MPKLLKILIISTTVAICIAAIALAWHYSPSSRAERLTKLGIETGKNGEVEKAMEIFQEAVKIAPGHFLARFNLGEVFLAFDRNEEALKEFKAAEALRPHDALTLYELARIYSRTGKKDEALSYLERSIDEGFNDIPRLNNDDDFTPLREEQGFKDLLGRWEALQKKNAAGGAR